MSALDELLDYRKRNTLNFQLEKLDDFLPRVVSELAELRADIVKIEASRDALWEENEGRIKQMADWAFQMHEMRKALEFYANPENWHNDDWGVKAVINEYGDAGKIAREALKSEEK